MACGSSHSVCWTSQDTPSASCHGKTKIKLFYFHKKILFTQFFFMKSNICFQIFTEPVLFTESKDPLGAGFVANNTNAESDSNHNSSPNQVLPMSAQHSNTLSNTLSSHYR